MENLHRTSRGSDREGRRRSGVHRSRQFWMASSRAPKAKARSRYSIRSGCCAMNLASSAFRVRARVAARFGRRRGFGCQPHAAPERKVSLVSFDLGQAGICAAARSRPGNHPTAGARFRGSALGNRRSRRRDAARPTVAAGLIARAAWACRPIAIATSPARSWCFRSERVPSASWQIAPGKFFASIPASSIRRRRLLTRGAGDAEITSICRLDHGKRLVALLSPDHLFRSDLVRRVLSEHSGEDDGAAGRNGWKRHG